MLRGMVGTKELQASVEDIRQELPEMRELIISEFRTVVKNEFNNVVQALEMQMKNEIREIASDLTKDIENMIQPVNVVTAIEQREEDKKRQEEVEKIINKLSAIYKVEKEEILLEKTTQGNYRLTKEGTQLYNLLSETVVLIAKIHGSKSHMKVANPKSYEKFEKKEGLGDGLIKKRIMTSDGTGRESVYVDLICRGLVGDFTRFLEREFLSEYGGEQHA